MLENFNNSNARYVKVTISIKELAQGLNYYR